MIHVNGGTVIETNAWTTLMGDDGQVRDGFMPGDQVKAIPFDIFDGILSGQTVMESDNPTNNTTNLAVYGYGWVNFRFPYPAGWTLVGSGVVDGSGKSEEIWRNDATGKLGYWNINCSGTIRFGIISGMDCERVVGATIDAAAGYTPRLADLNGDGYIDIVWTSAKNDIYYWINDGHGNFTKSYGGTYPAGWELEGAGEIAGSGKTDLIWFNPATSQLGWWTMDGNQVLDRETRSVAKGYGIASIEDFDGDGLADILWTDSQGDAYVWQGTGGAFVSQRLADGLGNAYMIPAGYVVQKSRLQGVPAIASPSTESVAITR
jgi:hypothetical protein